MIETERNYASWEAIEPGFRAYLLTHRRAETTTESYLGQIRRFTAWCSNQELNAVEVHPHAVSAYLVELLGRLSHNSVPLSLSALRAFFSYCQREGWREDDPTVGQSIKWRDTPPEKPFTNAEVRALLRACNERDRAMILVSFSLGLRVSEVVRIRSQHIDVEKHLLYVRGKGEKARWLPLEPQILGVLQPFLNQPQGVLWWTNRGEPLSVKRAQRMIEQTAARIGLGGVHWHRFRVTFANQVLDAGVQLEDLRVLMGHSEISTTAHYAGHTINERALEELRRISPGRQLFAQEGAAS